MRPLLRLILFVIACVCASLLAEVEPGSAQQRSSPSDMLERLTDAPLPPRNPLDLAVRLRGSAPAPEQTPLNAPPFVVGAEQSFWILDQRRAELFQTSATLRVATDHAYWFVQTDLSDQAQQAELERSAAVFEARIYPVITRYFGMLPSPGVDGQSRVLFLLGNVPGVAAYFSSADAYRRAANPRSNEHDMIYVNLNLLQPGQDGFDSTITHELQHMAHFNRCPSQEGWVDEGASELAMRVAGYSGTPPTSFAAHPDVQLNAWSLSPSDVTRHYQAAYLFLRYVAERSGGWDALPTLFSSCARGEQLFGTFLAQEPIAPDLDSLFSDWTIANLLQDAAISDGRYAYAGGDFHAAITGTLSASTPFLGEVPQYAADYVALPAGTGTVTFNGDPSVSVLGAAVDDTGVWWSNRGDSVDTRLTRSLDLRGVTDATLQFKVWYELEPQFDFVYLSISQDGGQTWHVLSGRHSASDGATGNNYGVGWTGSSNSSWLDEDVDLAPFAGQDVLLRFEYITDQSYSGQGFALRDLQVPQLGIDEPGATDDRWTAEGWVRVDAPIPERWNLRVVRWLPDGTLVQSVAVDADGAASFALDPAASRQVLVIAPTAPRTLLSGSYSVSFSAPP